jgi:serine/threonine-protein kinase RsbW
LYEQQEAEQLRHGEVVEMEIPSAAEYVGIVRHAVEGIARRMAFEAAQIEDLKLAVGEACTNAVRHGCPNGNGHKVEIRCVVLAEGLQIEVKNSISDCEHPTVPAKPDLSKEGGLGLYLIRQLVDEVQFFWETDTAIIRMTKRRTAA